MGVSDSINNMAGKAKDAVSGHGDEAVDKIGDTRTRSTRARMRRRTPSAR
jgi:hypothetical protein